MLMQELDIDVYLFLLLISQSTCTRLLIQLIEYLFLRNENVFGYLLSQVVV